MTAFDENDISQNKIFAAISYLWILFLIPLLLRPQSPFAKAHAKQGLTLFIVQVISSLFIWVPIIGQLWNIVIIIVIPIMALVRALDGKYWPIPIISNYAEKISFD